MAETYWELFAGYTAVWILLSLFVIKLLRDQKQLQVELSRLSAKLDAGAEHKH